MLHCSWKLHWTLTFSERMYKMKHCIHNLKSKSPTSKNPKTQTLMSMDRCTAQKNPNLDSFLKKRLMEALQTMDSFPEFAGIHRSRSFSLCLLLEAYRWWKLERSLSSLIQMLWRLRIQSRSLALLPAHLSALVLHLKSGARKEFRYLGPCLWWNCTLSI